jgi:DNA-directed RNA polymerase specialized sigma24 family protein
MNEIILEISRLYQVDPLELISKNRTMPLPSARHQCFALAYTEGCKQTQIAKLFKVKQSTISRGITNYFKLRKS